MAKKSIPSICLYGSHEWGAGLLVEKDGKIVYGDGELDKKSSLTFTLWRGLQALADLGHKGPIEVYAPGGLQMAVLDLGKLPRLKAWPYYGDLLWQRAKTYELSIDDILKAGGHPVILLEKGGAS